MSLKKAKYITKALLIVVGLFFLLGCFAYLFPYQFHTPPPEVWYDSAGKVLIGHKQEQRTRFDEVPESIIDLVVAVEDERFRSHPWIDIHSIARAVRLYLKGVRPVQWASTIDQQLIKLDRQQFVRSRQAKLQENFAAFHLQFHHSKEDILLRYLNSILFSHGIIGWKSACLSYRWIPCGELTDAQLAVLLVIGQRGINPYRARGRQTIVDRLAMYMRVRPDLFSELLIDDVLRDQLQSFPAPLDPRVQEVIRQQTSPWSTAYDLDLNNRIDTLLSRTAGQREQYGIRDCCVVVLDGDGELLSMNMCTQRDAAAGGKVTSCLTPRQTWSALKPFLYLYAFKQLWVDMDDTIVDEPVQFDLGGGNLYDPKNFDLSYHGEVTYAYALGNSLNVPAVKTLHAVGVWPFLDFLKKQLQRADPAGPLTSKTADEVGLSLALWTYEISPWQFTQLRRILLPNMVPAGYESQRLQIVEILRNPVYKLVSFWQDNFLNRWGRAVKTGTSRRFIDGWICGVSDTRGAKAQVMCLRVGNITNEPMLWASSEVGSYLRGLLVDSLSTR
jgi:penicillin-binding protein 1C